MIKVLLLGGAGFIGVALSDRLREEGAWLSFSLAGRSVSKVSLWRINAR
jgi:nucleoside-diphosphate-sugar epimerase